MAEKRKGACIAREYEIALPHELNKKEQTSLAREFAKHIVKKYGNAVDLCIHAPDKHGDERNHHVYILTTTRKIKNGELGEKCDIEKAGRNRKSDLLEIREYWERIANKYIHRAIFSHGNPYLKVTCQSHEA